MLLLASALAAELKKLAGVLGLLQLSPEAFLAEGRRLFVAQRCGY